MAVQGLNIQIIHSYMVMLSASSAIKTTHAIILHGGFHNIHAINSCNRVLSMLSRSKPQQKQTRSFQNDQSCSSTESTQSSSVSLDQAQVSIVGKAAALVLITLLNNIYSQILRGEITIEVSYV